MWFFSYFFYYLLIFVAFPLGKLPIFEVDGKSFTQSVAIARYVAKQVKLTGKNDLEDLVIEAAVDTVIDARNGGCR